MSPRATIKEHSSSSSQALNLKAAAYFNHSFDQLGRSLPPLPPSSALSSPSSPSSPSSGSDQQLLERNIDVIRRRREAARLRYQKIRSNIIMSREIEQSSRGKAEEQFHDNSDSISTISIPMSMEEASIQEEGCPPTSSSCYKEALLFGKQSDSESPSVSGVTDLILSNKDDACNDECGRVDDSDYGVLYVIYL
mmetsp:Transcript_23185/g.34517  ORF Transcript_23185/g.34517 Transcript_23185/m.34517 type:complete len:194 (+) Transcript_23185:159-740(+)